MRAVLTRLKNHSNEHQTCGRFILFNDSGEIALQCYSLEPAWKNNLSVISCIPEGVYTVNKGVSLKYGRDTFKVNGVPGRSNILIHPGNFTLDTEGCILLGDKFDDLDKDKLTDVANSKATVGKLKSLADSFTLTIIWI